MERGRRHNETRSISLKLRMASWTLLTSRFHHQEEAAGRKRFADKIFLSVKFLKIHAYIYIHIYAKYIPKFLNFCPHNLNPTNTIKFLFFSQKSHFSTRDLIFSLFSSDLPNILSILFTVWLVHFSYQKDALW